MGNPTLFLLLGVVQKLSPELANLLGSLAGPGLGIYSARVVQSGSGFHFEIELDGIGHPLGSVTLAECEAFSRRFAETLDLVLLEGHPDRVSALPVGITPDNYTVEVNSAGAERKLRLPGDLQRFAGVPLRIQFTESGSRQTRLGVYGVRPAGEAAEPQADVASEQDYYFFMEYTPRRTGKNRKRSAKKTVAEFRVPVGDILQVNLYLDF